YLDLGRAPVDLGANLLEVCLDVARERHVGVSQGTLDGLDVVEVRAQKDGSRRIAVAAREKGSDLLQRSSRMQQHCGSSLRVKGLRVVGGDQPKVRERVL